MTANFTTEIEGTTFEFKTMNAEKLQLFAVHVVHEETRKRFHMQFNTENNGFKFANADACPEPYRHLEKVFHHAILAQHDLAE